MTARKKKEEFYADMLLLLVTMNWGFSYLAINTCIPEMGTLGLNAYRFITAGAVTAFVFRKRLMETDKTTFRWSLIVGVTLAVTYGLTNMSIRYTSTSNAAFLCAMGVIFVPVIELIFMHKRQTPVLIIAVIMSAAGIALLTLTGGGRLPQTHIFGDICGILTAIVYAVETIATGIAVKEKKLDAVQIGVLSMIWTGILMLIISIAAGDIGLPKSTGAVVSVLFLTFICTAFSFIAQPVAQVHTEASHVGIIFALEPLFAGLVALFIQGIVPGKMQLAGQILMFSSFLLLEAGEILMNKKDTPDDVSS